jgi:predicted short-subunit dehydrogenase-like oxidoreductase (DUF2520 family)
MREQGRGSDGRLRVVIAGRGKVGRGLARALRPTDVRTRVVRARTMGRRQVAHADLLILAVPDDAIASCAHRVAAHLAPGTAVVHCAGMRGLDALDACRARGLPVAAMHPMASFADAARPPRLEGTSLVVAGDPAAVRVVRRMAKAMHARVITGEVHGPVYHAAAVLAANATVALATSAARLLQSLGMRRSDSLHAVAGLLRTVAENVERVGVPGALTGPVARGDARTVNAHRAALATIDRQALNAYERVAPVILETAVAGGLSPARARSVKRALASPPRTAAPSPDGGA